MELDHAFICCDAGDPANPAPDAQLLIDAGFREGPPNRHPGQGTANRRFFFRNAMIELLYVCDETEAQSDLVRPARLFERWSMRHFGASPFGICLRPSVGGSIEPPFPTWPYDPPYLPEGVAIHVADTPVTEPMWFFLGFSTRAGYEARFQAHPNGAREVTRVSISAPVPMESSAARAVIEAGMIEVRTAPDHLLEIELDHRERGRTADFRPALALVIYS